MLKYPRPMIPLKLTLQNFLCYRDDVPTLDLTGIRVACLCGGNGHGKSALLDAITWALWGKARGSSHSDLLHHGRSNMHVDLEFQAADAHYRVIRRFRSPRGSDLQLQLKGPAGFHPITGNSIRESQSKINRIIGMDYDTFINSAFLIQGRADEFTNKTPAERKEVLGKIIGLERFNDLQRRSRDKASDSARRGDGLEGTLRFMRQETAAKEQLASEFEAVVLDLDALSLDLEQKNLRAQDLRLGIQNLERRTAQAEEIRLRIPQLQTEISQYEAEARQHSARIENYQSLIDRQPSIKDGFSQYKQSLDENDRLNAARAQFDDLSREIHSLQQTVAQAKARLEEQLLTQTRLLKTELEPTARKASDLQRRLSETANSLEVLSNDEKSLEQENARLQHLTVQAHTLSEAQERLKVEGQQLADKLKLLNASHQDARCPLCDTSLGEAGCHRLAASYDKEIRQKRQEYAQNQHTLIDLESRQKRLTHRLREQQKTLQRQKQQTQRHTVILERQLEDSRRAAEQAKNVRGDVQRLENTILNGQFAPEQQADLKTAQASLEALNYSPQRHDDLSRRLQELQKFQLLSQQLSEANQHLPQEQKALAQARKATQDRQDQLRQILEALSSLESEHTRLAESKSQLSLLSSDIRKLESQQKTLIARRGQLQGSLQRIEELERQITQQTRDLNRLREEQSIYEELRVAFGREGVQALLIDTILPQIEEYANDLLARMTEGRMHVKLESQRPLQSRKGQFAETLEIKVSDELGHRSYEMFSGGESFRINLALRIALSKVLANRSGAPLPTLFIDEGFGTQDSAGREQILDVLSTLEQDFKCIIVITHLDELKDYFPVRIEVEKRDGASTAWIS